jgi:acyl carrier protein
MALPTFGKRGRCPACSAILPDFESKERSCPRCSARLWFVRFDAAGPRFLLAQKERSLNDVLAEMAQPQSPDLVRLLRTSPEKLGADSFDVLELNLELLDELERHLPELSD